jgi:hypothetical protein
MTDLSLAETRTNMLQIVKAEGARMETIHQCVPPVDRPAVREQRAELVDLQLTISGLKPGQHHNSFTLGRPTGGPVLPISEATLRQAWDRLKVVQEFMDGCDARIAIEGRDITDTVSSVNRWLFADHIEAHERVCRLEHLAIRLGTTTEAILNWDRDDIRRHTQFAVLQAILDDAKRLDGEEAQPEQVDIAASVEALKGFDGLLDWLQLTRKNRPLPDLQPWAEAVEMQYRALAHLDTDRRVIVLAGQILKAAESFSWGIEPLAAVRTAALSLPTDTVLTSDLLPAGAAGWWYFNGPFPASALDEAVPVCALTYGWCQDDEGFRGLNFVTWLMGRVTKGKPLLLPGGKADLQTQVQDGIDCAPLPSDSWFWREGETMEAMLRRSLAVISRKTFKAGSWEQDQMTDQDKRELVERTTAMSLFFVAGIYWLQQRILVESSGHIERHHGKRMAQTYKLKDRPRSVKVIELRRREASTPTGETREVNWSCRWIVDGHWRRQRVGAGRAEMRTIWINAFVKGPEDKPLRMPTHTVYTVNR